MFATASDLCSERGAKRDDSQHGSGEDMAELREDTADCLINDDHDSSNKHGDSLVAARENKCIAAFTTQ